MLWLMNKIGTMLKYKLLNYILFLWFQIPFGLALHLCAITFSGITICSIKTLLLWKENCICIILLFKNREKICDKNKVPVKPYGLKVKLIRLKELNMNHYDFKTQPKSLIAHKLGFHKNIYIYLLVYIHFDLRNGA